jgi:hypothetical protein
MKVDYTELKEMKALFGAKSRLAGGNQTGGSQAGYIMVTTLLLCCRHWQNEWKMQASEDLYGCSS